MEEKEQDERDKEQYYLPQYEPLYYEEEEGVPHYIKYKEELISKIIDVFSKMSGVAFYPPTISNKELTENPFLSTGYNPEYRKSANIIPYLVQAIVNAGCKQQMLEYLNMQISERKLHLEQHNLAGGKITPIVFDTPDKEDTFWCFRYIFTSQEDEEKLEAKQRLEIDRLFYKWLVDLKMDLYIEPELIPKKEAQPKKKKQMELTYDSMFRSKDKGEKLITLLKNKGILDENGRWSWKDTDIVVLTYKLIDKNLVKSDKKLPVGRALCKKVGLFPVPFDKSNFQKPKGDLAVHGEFDNIVSLL